MAEKSQKTDVTPQRIINDLWMARASQVLVAGVELDVFTHIAEDKTTVKEIARAAKASERGMVHLLDTLVALEYLTKKGADYKLAPVAKMFLVRGKDSYVGGFVYEVKHTRENWAQLTDVIKTGKSVESVDSERSGREFFPKLVEAIFPLSFGTARSAVAALPEKTKKQIKNILDVAAGSGAWSLAFAETIPDAQVTAVDYEEVTKVTRRYAERFGVTDRYNYIEGNLREANFGRNRYDLVILGQIIHSEGEKWGKKLIKKSYDALKDGGVLLIAEVIPNDNRTAPVLPLLFGLNMLVHTADGDVFTMREYKEWLKSTGFKKVSTIDANSISPLILATK